VRTMPDLEDRVRDLLERRAADVGPRLEVPPTLVRRARLRFVAYAAVACVVIAVAAVGAGAAIRAMPSAPVERPGDNSGAPYAPPGTCGADQLAASGTVEGAMGSRDGTITVRNASSTACVMDGKPAVVLEDQTGAPITDGVEISTGQAPKASITLQPGQTAQVTYQWSNWCGADAAPTWHLVAPAGGEVTIGGVGSEAPPCNGPGFPSTITLGSYEVPAAH
jgi:uncharacterized protein DUF4232